MARRREKGARARWQSGAAMQGTWLRRCRSGSSACGDPSAMGRALGEGAWAGCGRAAAGLWCRPPCCCCLTQPLTVPGMGMKQKWKRVEDSNSCAPSCRGNASSSESQHGAAVAMSGCRGSCLCSAVGAEARLVQVLHCLLLAAHKQYGCVGWKRGAGTRHTPKQLRLP